MDRVAADCGRAWRRVRMPMSHDDSSSAAAECATKPGGGFEIGTHEVAEVRLVVHLLPRLLWGSAPALDRNPFDLTINRTEAEVSGGDRDQGVQPDVMAVERDKPKRRVEDGNESHDQKYGIDHCRHLGEDAGTGEASICGDAPDAEGRMNEVVQCIDREQPEQPSM